MGEPRIFVARAAHLNRHHPVWVKHSSNACQAAAKEGGPLLRSLNNVDRVGKSLNDWAVWSVVTEFTKEIGIERFEAHDPPYVSETLSQGGSGFPNQVSAGPLVDTNDGARSRVRAGDRDRGRR